HFFLNDMNTVLLPIAFLLLSVSAGLAQPVINVDSVPINHIQIIGTHNSYRKAMDWGIMHTMRLLDPFYWCSPSPAKQLQYSHLPIAEQLGVYGIRSLEIDIHHDPEGGRYYYRKGNFLASKRADSGVEELKRPGHKVMHIADVDYNTHHYTFRDVLMEVKKWSDRHPRHLPIYILVEPKEDSPGDHVKAFGLVPTLKFDSLAWAMADEDIWAVFGERPEQVFTPDELRGEYGSLREAIMERGWPLLGAMRGRIVFIIHSNVRHADKYAEHRPSFRGRPMFAQSQADREHAAFIKLDDPFPDDVAQHVQQGFMVRTRTDTPGHEARRNDTSMREAAFASGAQILSTDYYRPDPKLSDFQVFFEGGSVAKLNFLARQQGEVLDWGEK
ncbi:MAG: phosphatidylinositol-specific phospholipase C1-like protein, partial [Flavobacteriales bacterium]|nr:phosphatidylinositol-specific phospholipase C1-like protein [Flavobacteriales bacterium]